jgi:hypothetical protein
MALALRVVRITLRLVVWLLPLALRIARLLGLMVATSLASLWVGVPKATELMADRWTTTLTNVFPLDQYERRIFSALRVWAVLLIIAGWVIASFFTVSVIRLVLLVVLE